MLRQLTLCGGPVNSHMEYMVVRGAGVHEHTKKVQLTDKYFVIHKQKRENIKEHTISAMHSRSL